MSCFRYTQQYGKARMEMKVGLTYACMNLKKLARILKRRGMLPTGPGTMDRFFTSFLMPNLKRRKAVFCHAT